MEDDRLKIRKVHLASMMQILSELYDRGVDFVDIYGAAEDGQDTVIFSFSKSYMDEEFAESFDNFLGEQSPSNIKIKLSDDDINQLLE